LLTIVRWTVVFVLLFAVLLMLNRPMPPAPKLDQKTVMAKSQSFESKLETIEDAQQRGEAAPEQHFDTEEVNAFLQTATEAGMKAAMAEAQRAGGSSSTAQAPAASGNGGSVDVPADGYTDVHAPQVSFTADEVTAQVVAKRYGRDIYVTVKGHLGSTPDGYVTFAPTEFEVGSLRVPVSLVDPQLQKRLSDPDVHDRLKLPAFIRALKVEDGELVIVPK